LTTQAGGTVGDMVKKRAGNRLEGKSAAILENLQRRQLILRTLHTTGKNQDLSHSHGSW